MSVTSLLEKKCSPRSKTRHPKPKRKRPRICLHEGASSMFWSATGRTGGSGQERLGNSDRKQENRLRSDVRNLTTIITPDNKFASNCNLGFSLDSSLWAPAAWRRWQLTDGEAKQTSNPIAGGWPKPQVKGTIRSFRRAFCWWLERVLSSVHWARVR